MLKKFKLPNPDKIKKEKGLDVFFKDGVPDRLRQIALRRVWKLNPIIRFADAEINDYHEDFTDAATVIEGMQTAYQVGKGYLSEILENKDEETHAEKPKFEKLEPKPKTKNIYPSKRIIIDKLLKLYQGYLKGMDFALYPIQQLFERHLISYMLAIHHWLFSYLYFDQLSPLGLSLSNN